MTFKESVRVQRDRQTLSVSPWTHRVTPSTVDTHDFSHNDRFDEDTNNLHPIMCSMGPTNPVSVTMVTPVQNVTMDRGQICAKYVPFAHLCKLATKT